MDIATIGSLGILCARIGQDYNTYVRYMTVASPLILSIPSEIPISTYENLGQFQLSVLGHYMFYLYILQSESFTL